MISQSDIELQEVVQEIFFSTLLEKLIRSVLSIM